MARQPSALRAREMLALLPTLRRGATIRLADLAAALGSTQEHVVELLEDLVFCGVPPFSPDTLIDLDIQADSVTVNSEPPALSRPLRLTRAELRAVLAALETAGVDPEDPLVQKLTEAAGSAGAVDALASTLRAQPEIGAAETYALLADAIETSRKVRLSYWSLGDDPRGRQRVVQPHALVNRTGVWYLTAFCESAGAVRTFRLDRIREATVLNEGFPPPADPQTAVVPDTAGLPVATLRVRAGYPIDDRDWPGAATAEAADGSLIVRLPYATTTWVAREVCSALGAIEVVEPQSLRVEVRAFAERLLADAQR